MSTSAPARGPSARTIVLYSLSSPNLPGLIIWAIMDGQTKGTTVKHVNTSTRVGLNSRAGKSETSFALFTLCTLL